jgi:hypothetical protein
MPRPEQRRVLLCLGLAAIALPAAASADWLLMQQPPDVDKDSPNMTCWLAAAANMLAGADYGYSYGSTVQERADGIYAELVNHFGTSE